MSLGKNLGLDGPCLCVNGDDMDTSVPGFEQVSPCQVGDLKLNGQSVLVAFITAVTIHY